MDKKDLPQTLREAYAIGAYVTSQAEATPLYTKEILQNVTFS